MSYTVRYRPIAHLRGVNFSMASRAPALPTTQRARAIPPRNAPASPATLAAGGTQTEPRLPLPKHTRSPIAKARRQQIKRQKAKGGSRSQLPSMPHRGSR